MSSKAGVWKRIRLYAAVNKSGPWQWSGCAYLRCYEICYYTDDKFVDIAGVEHLVLGSGAIPVCTAQEAE